MGFCSRCVLHVQAEFAHYAAQLGLDVQQYSDQSTPMGILLNHPNLRQAGKLYDFDLLNLKPGDTMTATMFFFGFLTLITLIGVTNIINTLDTNIKLRRREIAMLRSVGLTPIFRRRIKMFLLITTPPRGKRPRCT